eukprot:6763209-Prymnesium_polylepis.1
MICCRSLLHRTHRATRTCHQLSNVPLLPLAQPARALVAAPSTQSPGIAAITTDDGRVGCPFCGGRSQTLGGAKRGKKYTYLCESCTTRWNQRIVPNEFGDYEISLSKRALPGEKKRSEGYACGKCGAKPKQGHICPFSRNGAATRPLGPPVSDHSATQRPLMLALAPNIIGVVNTVDVEASAVVPSALALTFESSAPAATPPAATPPAATPAATTPAAAPAADAVVACALAQPLAVPADASAAIGPSAAAVAPAQMEGVLDYSEDDEYSADDEDAEHASPGPLLISSASSSQTCEHEQQKNQKMSTVAATADPPPSPPDIANAYS